MITADVAVLGGGAAGLAAARDLSHAGFRTILLEARPRLGGRILTVRTDSLPIPLELGAEFVHGTSPEVLGIAEAATLLVDELPDRHLRLEGGRYQPLTDFWRTLARVRARIPAGRDRSFGAFLASRNRLPARARALALEFVTGYHAADPDRISALSLRAPHADPDPEETRQFRLVGGYGGIVDALRSSIARDAEVRLSTVVRRVAWKPGAVTIDALTAAGRDERITARRIVLAVPVAVLKARPEAPASIRFTPPLTPLERDLGAIEVGHVVKVILRFRSRFWDDLAWLRARTGEPHPNPLQFLHAPGEPIPTWWTSAPARTSLLTGWAGGPAALPLLAAGEGGVVEAALATLARVTSLPRATLDRLVESVHLHDWSTDPWSLGAYSWVAVGGVPAQKRLSRPVEGTIFLAGEATDSDQIGTVAGAIASGRRAARQVLDSFLA